MVQTPLPRGAVGGTPWAPRFRTPEGELQGYAGPMGWTMQGSSGKMYMAYGGANANEEGKVVEFTTDAQGRIREVATVDTHAVGPDAPRVMYVPGESHGGITLPSGEFVPEGVSTQDFLAQKAAENAPPGPVRRDWNGNVIQTQTQINAINKAKQAVFDAGLTSDWVATDAGYKPGQKIGTSKGLPNFYVGTEQPYTPIFSPSSGRLSVPITLQQAQLAREITMQGPPMSFRRMTTAEFLAEVPKGAAPASTQKGMTYFEGSAMRLDRVLKNTPLGYAPLSTREGPAYAQIPPILRAEKKTEFDKYFESLKPEEQVGLGLTKKYTDFIGGLKNTQFIKGLDTAQGPMADVYKGTGGTAEIVGMFFVGGADLAVEAARPDISARIAYWQGKGPRVTTGPARAVGLAITGSLIYGGGIAYKAINRDYAGAAQDVIAGVVAAKLFKMPKVASRKLSFEIGRKLYGDIPESYIITREPMTVVETLVKEKPVKGGSSALVKVETSGKFELYQFSLRESLKAKAPRYTVEPGTGFGKGELITYEPTPTPKGIPQAPAQAVSNIKGIIEFEGGHAPFESRGYQVLTPAGDIRAFVSRDFTLMYASKKGLALPPGLKMAIDWGKGGKFGLEPEVSGNISLETGKLTKVNRLSGGYTSATKFLTSSLAPQYVRGSIGFHTHPPIAARASGRWNIADVEDIMVPSEPDFRYLSFSGNEGLIFTEKGVSFYQRLTDVQANRRLELGPRKIVSPLRKDLAYSTEYFAYSNMKPGWWQRKPFNIRATLIDKGARPTGAAKSTSYGFLRATKRTFDVNPLTGQEVPQGVERGISQSVSVSRIQQLGRKYPSFAASKMDIYFIGKSAKGERLVGEDITGVEIHPSGQQQRLRFKDGYALGEFQIGEFSRSQSRSLAGHAASVLLTTQARAYGRQTSDAQERAVRTQTKIASVLLWRNARTQTRGTSQMEDALRATRSSELYNTRTVQASLARVVEGVRPVEAMRYRELTLTRLMTGTTTRTTLRSILRMPPTTRPPIITGTNEWRQPPPPFRSVEGSRKGGSTKRKISYKGRRTEKMHLGIAPISDLYSKTMTEAKTFKPAHSPSEATSRKYFYRSGGLFVPTAEMIAQKKRERRRERSGGRKLR